MADWIVDENVDTNWGTDALGTAPNVTSTLPSGSGSFLSGFAFEHSIYYAPTTASDAVGLIHQPIGYLPQGTIEVFANFFFVNSSASETVETPTSSVVIGEATGGGNLTPAGEATLIEPFEIPPLTSVGINYVSTISLSSPGSYDIGVQFRTTDGTLDDRPVTYVDNIGFNPVARMFLQGSSIAFRSSYNSSGNVITIGGAIDLPTATYYAVGVSSITTTFKAFPSNDEISGTKLECSYLRNEYGIALQGIGNSEFFDQGTAFATQSSQTLGTSTDVLPDQTIIEQDDQGSFSLPALVMFKESPSGFHGSSATTTKQDEWFLVYERLTSDRWRVARELNAGNSTSSVYQHSPGTELRYINKPVFGAGEIDVELDIPNFFDPIPANHNIMLDGGEVLLYGGSGLVEFTITSDITPTTTEFSVSLTDGTNVDNNSYVAFTTVGGKKVKEYVFKAEDDITPDLAYQDFAITSVDFYIDHAVLNVMGAAPLSEAPLIGSKAYSVDANYNLPTDDFSDPRDTTKAGESILDWHFVQEDYTFCPNPGGSFEQCNSVVSQSCLDTICLGAFTSGPDHSTYCRGDYYGRLASASFEFNSSNITGKKIAIEEISGSFNSPQVILTCRSTSINFNMSFDCVASNLNKCVNCVETSHAGWDQYDSTTDITNVSNVASGSLGGDNKSFFLGQAKQDTNMYLTIATRGNPLFAGTSLDPTRFMFTAPTGVADGTALALLNPDANIPTPQAAGHFYYHTPRVQLNFAVESPINSNQGQLIRFGAEAITNNELPYDGFSTVLLGVHGRVAAEIQELPLSNLIFCDGGC